MISAPKPIKTTEKSINFIQDDKTYKIELSQNSNNVLISIKDLNRIDVYYKLEISVEDIQKKYNF